MGGWVKEKKQEAVIVVTCDQALLFFLVREGLERSFSSPSRTRRKSRAWSQVLIVAHLVSYTPNNADKLINYSGSKSSPNSSSANSSSTTAALCLPAVLGLAGASPRGSEYVASGRRRASTAEREFQACVASASAQSEEQCEFFSLSDRARIRASAKPRAKGCGRVFALAPILARSKIEYNSHCFSLHTETLATPLPAARSTGSE